MRSKLIFNGRYELFENASELAKNIVELKLYKEEDVFNYVPNYLRSEING